MSPFACALRHFLIQQQSSPYGQRFAISDNGIGIARENFDLVFVPLKRLHCEETPDGSIGLALCRKIIERHDESMWVESSVEKAPGSFFTLPAHPGSS
jgi:light-regulated signal transduction histidine kinase (bacteriophytochrome)